MSHEDCQELYMAPVHGARRSAGILADILCAVPVSGWPELGRTTEVLPSLFPYLSMCVCRCEADLTQPRTCKSCSNSCLTSVSNADGITCNPDASLASACSYGSCKTGFADCDGNTSNGCEASLQGIRSCGSCGTDCTKLVANAVSVSCAPADATSSEHFCTYGKCATGWGDCDLNVTNGCETRLNNPQACGSCLSNCSSSVLNVKTALCDSGSTCRCVPHSAVLVILPALGILALLLCCQYAKMWPGPSVSHCPGR
jgi:hypothetical protein